MTNFRELYLREVIESLNILFKRETPYVSVKNIRNIKNLKSSERSKINFYWRSLEQLEQKGFLKLKEIHGVRRYKVLKLLDINEVLEKLDDYIKCNGNHKESENDDSNGNSYFDWELTFRKKINES